MATQVTGSYTNPIIPGSSPDPSIIRVGEDFYLTTSTFEYFPGAPIYHSRDLIRWKLIGHALSRKSQLDIKTPEPGGGVWATTLRYCDGWFYITTCVFDRYRPQADDRVWPRGFYVRTRDIWKDQSWSDPVYFDQVGFDQDLFWDDDGSCYLSTTYRKVDRSPESKLKDFCVHASRIDVETGSSLTSPVLLRESSSGVSEGSHIFKRGRYYYLFTAEGGTESGHSEWVLRSDKGPLGPYELGPQNPLWRNTTKDDVQNTGHCDLVQTAAGDWWAVCLAVRPHKTSDGTFERSVFGRETFLLPVKWQDDWPIFNEGSPIQLHGQGPGMHELQHDVRWTDDFTKKQLGWYRKNTPIKPTDISLYPPEKPDRLRLYGSAYSLSSPAAPTTLLRKQTQRNMSFATKLSFHPTSSQTEAGVVVYYNYFTSSSLGIRLDPATSKRIVRFRPAEGPVVEKTLDTVDSPVELWIRCQDSSYSFHYREFSGEGQSTESEVIGSVSTEAMTRDPPVGMAFGGMMLGLYAYGELEPCLVPADFWYAETADG
ncbi:hypothetical protein MBLNU230_g8258t1 [Neophaeotheca triangularis]